MRFSPISTITCLIGVCGAGSEHTTSTDRDDEQAGSPSDAASVTVARPVCVQVRVGLAVVAPSSAPEVVVQLNDSGDGTWSTSTVVPCSAIVAPTATSAGLASMPSIRAHTFSVPLTMTLPVSGWSWQARWTDTVLVTDFATSNVAEPAQSARPSDDIERSAIE